jgi:HAD superfamily hydrolase (TIGR01549 family)
MLKIVSFDMDGTLVSSRYVESVWLERMPELYAERYGLGFEEAKERVYDEYMSVGSGDLRWYDLRYWLAHFDIHETWDSLLNQYRDRIEFYPEVEEALQLLSNYDLVVASNGAREFVETELDGIKHYFKEVFSITSDFEKVKNFPEAYLDMCNYLDVRPEEVIHIGDHRHYDYEVARKAGLNALYLDREGMETGPDVVGDLREAAERILKL